MSTIANLAVRLCEVLANSMYISAFSNYEMDYAGAIAVVLFVIMLFFIAPYLIYVARTELKF
ncbi:MAG: hypothetical protein ABI947_28415 [Chloroflexota bacterium]